MDNDFRETTDVLDEPLVMMRHGKDKHAAWSKYASSVTSYALCPTHTSASSPKSTPTPPASRVSRGVSVRPGEQIMVTRRCLEHREKSGVGGGTGEGALSTD